MGSEELSPQPAELQELLLDHRARHTSTSCICDKGGSCMRSFVLGIYILTTS